MIVERALDAMAEAVLPATEAYARLLLGAVTGGAHWDLRVGAGLQVDLWDEERDAWTAANELPVAAGRLIDLAVAVAFVAAATPRDVTHPPAFLWLTQGETAGDGVAALLDAIGTSALTERFPQIIVACEPERFVPAGFDDVVPIVRGRTSPRLDPRQSLPARLKAVG
ncbi:MAG: hypothetical protein FJ029_15645 [Actinobacteria bacterium]|nr:hypothetical protein [Actinomycetota bacterium]